jgi:hypothetical protein
LKNIIIYIFFYTFKSFNSEDFAKNLFIKRNIQYSLEQIFYINNNEGTFTSKELPSYTKKNVQNTPFKIKEKFKNKQTINEVYLNIINNCDNRANMLIYLFH